MPLILCWYDFYMLFTVVISGAPYTTPAPYTALRFAESAIASGHGIHRIFLHGDGVLCASTLTVCPSGKLNVCEKWQAFIAENKIDTVACISSALKRGIINEEESARHSKPSSNLSPAVHLSGLGQLIESINLSDRVICFG